MGRNLQSPASVIVAIVGAEGQGRGCEHRKGHQRGGQYGYGGDTLKGGGG